jgi:chromosome segregation ATPase
MAAVSALIGSMDGGSGLNASGTGGVEMAKALSSMQIRNEQFRQLYEQLKQEYATLSDAYADCQRTLEKATEENRQMQDKFKNLLDKLQIENRKKTTQIEEMKSQVCCFFYFSSFSQFCQSYLVT